MTQLAGNITFACPACSEQHELPLSMGFSMPDFVSKLLPWERESRCKMSPDWCIVDDTFYYLRGCLEIPISGTAAVLSWGVWTTISEEDFDRTMELWDSPARVEEPEYTGTLANTLPSYKETRNIATTIQTRAVGDRPGIRINEPNHALFVDQTDGIPMDKAIELAIFLLHAQSSNPYSHLCEK